MHRVIDDVEKGLHKRARSRNFWRVQEEIGKCAVHFEHLFSSPVAGLRQKKTCRLY